MKTLLPEEEKEVTATMLAWKALQLLVKGLSTLLWLTTQALVLLACLKYLIK